MSEENQNPDEFKDSTVQDIIDRLMQVEDKSQPFKIEIWDDEEIGINYSSINIHEFVKSDGTPSSVAFEVNCIHKLKQLFDNEFDEEDDSNERVIDYYGQEMAISPYEEKHRPQNQKLVQGVPLDPILRDDFDSTPNEERDELETSDWWSRPFIRTCTWSDMAGGSYGKYRESVSDKEKLKSPEEFEREREERRIKWFEAWPKGVRYDVRCLDGGAWDRSTGIAMVSSLDEAVSIAKSMAESE